MDENFSRIWFAGFADGLESLDGPSREVLLSHCAGCCADSSPVGLYEKTWARSHGELQTFFHLLGTADGIHTAQQEPGKSWQIIYPVCGCDLVTGGYVTAPALCECSRLSILYCLRRAMPEYEFTVTKEQSILQGDGCCCFRIELKKEPLCVTCSSP